MTNHDIEPSAGFTLIEVIVAFAILAISLTALFGVFSSGPRWSSDGAAQRTALLLAESKLADLLAQRGLRESVRQGRFDNGMLWREDVQTLGDRGDFTSMRVLKVSVAVAASDRAKEPFVALTTLYLEPKLRDD